MMCEMVVTSMPRPTTSVATSSVDLAVAEAAHDAVAGRLLEVAVDRVHVADDVGQPAMHLFGAPLRAAENNRLPRLLALDQL